MLINFVCDTRKVTPRLTNNRTRRLGVDRTGGAAGVQRLPIRNRLTPFAFSLAASPTSTAAMMLYHHDLYQYAFHFAEALQEPKFAIL